MHVLMGVPLRVATATSNLMIGITASASAIIYLLRGEHRSRTSPAPTAIGVFIGASIGSRTAHRIDLRVLRGLFVVDPALHCLADAPASARMTPAERPASRADRRRAVSRPRAVDRPAAHRRHVRRRSRSCSIGVVLMVATGVGPLSGGPPLRRRDASRVTCSPLRPAGFLWLGLIVVVATPVARVLASLVGYVRRGETRMAVVAAPILLVIALSVVLATASRGLTMDLLVLVGAFVVILAGAELFTNGIEWFGRKLELAEGAVGSVLAAVGTALPETMIPIIAILSGGGSDGVRTGSASGRSSARRSCSRRWRCS